MGYNATVVVLTDHLATIEADAGFGQRVAEAISTYDPTLGPEPILDGDGTMIALLLETHPSEVQVHLVVGGDSGYITGRSLTGVDTGATLFVNLQDETRVQLRGGWTANSFYVAGYPVEGQDYVSWPLNQIHTVEIGPVL